MSIFTNYDNLSPDYIPDNISEKEQSKEVKNNKPPRVVLNAKKEFIGYCWYNGEKFDFTVKTDYKQEEVQNKTLSLVIHNFRGDFVTEASANDSTSVTLPVDDRINELMLAGIYKATLKCMSQDKVEFEQLFDIAVL